MALPTITFNSSTGSDTAASGAGPATALSGTGAATTNAATTIDLSADAPNLSGVSTTGDAVLWVDTSAGRQFFKITGVNNTTKVVTVANAAGATNTGKNWGIGGKRATFDNTNSRKLFSADVLPGWTIDTETDQSTSSAISCAISGNNTNTTGGPIRVRGTVTTKASRKRITGSHNGQIFQLNANYWRFESLRFSCSNGTKTAATAFFNNNDVTQILIVNCGCDATDPIGRFYNDGTLGASVITMFDCDIVSTDRPAIERFTTGGGSMTLVGCLIARCGTTSGAAFTGNSVGMLFVINCHIVKNVRGAFDLDTSFGWTGYPRLFINNNISYNGGDGINLDNSTTGFLQSLVFVNNILANNDAGAGSNYGFNGVAVSPDVATLLGIIDYNTYYGNRTAPVLNITQGAHDVTAQNPTFADHANLDFTLGNTALDGAAFPGASVNFPGTITPNHNYPGPSQPASGGGGGSSAIPRLVNGGLVQ